MDTILDKQALLGKIRDTIKSFVDGDISSREAEDSYEQFRQELDQTFLAPSAHAEQSDGLFIKLFAGHNISNFCKLTCEISVTGSDFQIVGSSGSESLISLIKNELVNEISKISQNVFTLPPFMLEDLEYRAFAVKSACVDDERFLVAVTSSKYSREDIFRKFTDIVNSYYTVSAVSGSPGTDSIYDNVRNDTVKILQKYVKGGVAVKAMLYRFDNIYEIFEHRGLKTLLDIDSRIVKSLQNYHGYEATVTILGPSIYLVLLPVENKGEEKKTRAPARLLFEYEDVIFRYWVYRQIIDNETGAASIFYWISETLKEANER